MSQVKEEKNMDTSTNGPNNANHRPKEEFHGGGGGRGGGGGGRGNRFQPYGGGSNRGDRKGPRDNNAPRGDFRNDSNNHGDHQGDEIMNRGGRNPNEGGRGGRRGGGSGPGGFRGGPPNRGDDRINRADAMWNDRLMQMMGPTHEIPTTNTTDRKFLSQCRLYIGNLVDCSEEELVEMFKPYGDVSEKFLNKEKMFAFIRLDYRANAEKAKRELDGQMRKGRSLKIRFAPIAAAIKVKNLTQFVSNELLEYAFSIFGDIERCQVMVDERGNSIGEGIIEFSRKNAAMNALKKCSEGCFFLTSSLRPCVVEPYEFVDNSDGLPDKLVPKRNTIEFQKERDAGPRFANPNTFEHEFGTRWKQLAELYKQKEDALKREMKLEEEKLEAQMEYARYEHETEMLREQLRQREMDKERQKMEWEMKERQAEEQRLREGDIFRRQNEDLTMRMHHQDEEMRRRQDKSSFMQDHRGLGKPAFVDGPPMPVEGMSVRELEAITGAQGMESTPFVETTFVRDNQGIMPPPGIFDGGPRGDRGGRWGQDRRNGQDRRRF